jgi:HemY protein
VLLVQTLATALSALNAAEILPWLARIEQTLQQQPGNPLLHYLAAHAGLSAKLWGKAAHWIDRCLPVLRGTALEPNAWRLHARLAEQRGDAAAAAQAWKKAAQV